jgi:hypothetical protein
MPSKRINHYTLTSGPARTVEFETLDEACDAVVLRFPVGAEFTIRRVPACGPPHVILHGTKATTRPRFLAS